MKLNIPYYSQKNNSKDCGPVCSQMILEYFGIKTNTKELVNELFYNEFGTSAYDNALQFLKHGLKVTAITAQPILFPPDIVKKLKNRKILLKYLRSSIAKIGKFKIGIRFIIKFILSGGKMRLEIPNEKHITNALKNGSLVLALLYARSLGSKEGGFHFVVISGFNKNSVYINNPLKNSIRKGWFPFYKFLYGLHASTCADIDNGTLLIVSKS